MLLVVLNEKHGDVVAVDFQTVIGLADVRAANPEEHILEGGRVGRAARRLLGLLLLSIFSSTGEFFMPASNVMPAMYTPGTS